MTQSENCLKKQREIHSIPANAKEMLWRIKQDFPHCFVSKPTPIKPIALGIRETLVDYYQKALGEDFNEAFLNESIKYYVNGYNYLQSIIHEENRVNLQGEVCGNITDKECNYAQHRWNTLHGANRGRNTSQEVKPIKDTMLPKNRPRLSLNKKIPSLI